MPRLTDPSVEFLTALQIAGTDIVPLVDISDTTDDPTGSGKKATFAVLSTFFASQSAFTGTYQPLHGNLTQLSALIGPGADRIVFWDESAGSFAYLTVGSNLTIDGTTLNASGGGGGGGGDALTSGTLAQFAATTSAELRGLISDETGTGALVFAGGNIGAATATTATAGNSSTLVATTAFVAGETATLTTAIASKEPAQTAASQAEAEAGTETAVRKWSPLRIWQAIRRFVTSFFGWFNVKDYGAVGDGVTNDATGINAAIAACLTAGGGTIFFPVGYYIASGAFVSRTNSLLTVPLATGVAGSAIFPRLRFLGAVKGAFSLATHGTYLGGVVIEAKNFSTPSGTAPSLFAAHPFSEPTVPIDTDDWNGVEVEFDEILFVCPGNSTIHGLTLNNTYQATIGRNVCVGTKTTGAGTEESPVAITPVTNQRWGICMPGTQNNVHCVVDKCKVFGFWWQLRAAECCSILDPYLSNGKYGIFIGRNFHGPTGEVTTQSCDYDIGVDQDADEALMHLTVHMEHVFGSPGRNVEDDGIYDFNIDDSGGIARGSVIYTNLGPSSVYSDATHNAGSSLKLKLTNDYKTEAELGGGSSSQLNNYLVFYPLSSTASQSGTFNLTNNNGVTFAAGKVGNAAQFVSASKQYLNVSPAPNLAGASAATITFWLKLTTLQIQSIAGQYHTAIDAAQWQIFSLADGTLTGGFFNDSTLTSVTWGTPLVAGTWYHVLLQFASGAVRMSVNNGAFVTATAPFTELNENLAPLILGQQSDNLAADNFYLNGMIDAMGIYAVALSADDRPALYNAGAGAEPPFS